VTDSDMVVQLGAVTKNYGGRGAATTALDVVTLGFGRGSFTAVMGPSGSGKSTLPHCAAGLDRPTSGSVALDGLDLTDMPERALARLRRERIGFVFQSFNLLPELSAADNVALPLRFSGKRPRRAAVTQALERVGLAGKPRARLGQLCGGQQRAVHLLLVHDRDRILLPRQLREHRGLGSGPATGINRHRR
jgi:putative ABC transport system ATP-binding protein